MTAYKQRREALLRAHTIDLTEGDEKGLHTVDTLCDPADAHERRVKAFALRIARGLPLCPGQRLTARDRAELADTQADAPTGRTAGKKRGRPAKDDGRKPLAEAMTAKRRLHLQRYANRGGTGPVPEWVGAHRLRQWRELVAQLLARTPGR